MQDSSCERNSAVVYFYIKDYVIKQDKLTISAAIGISLFFMVTSYHENTL